MAKKTTTAKRVRIKGANEADRQNIALARQANDKKEVVQRGDQTPEAAETPKEARAKAQALFEKADEAVQAEMIEANRRSLAVRGY